jgi:membrane fusion protein (multidrug efflux system)
MGKPPEQRSKRPFIILAIVLLAIALAGLVYYLLNRGYATTDDAQIDGNIYQISPRVSGQVLQVLVDDNQHVTKGQVLVQLDPRDAQAALDNAEAQLAVAQANLSEAQANVEVANADLLQAQQDYSRYSSINQRAISQQQLDSATATIRSAKAKYDSAAAKAAGMQASVDAAAVQVKNAQLQLSYTTITAPASGHIAERTVRAGDVEAAGAGLMAVVGDPVWVTANFKETQLPGIQPGDAATITVDAVPGITFKAHVDSIQSGTGAVFSLLPAQNATGNYVKIIQRVPVKIVFDDDRIGQYNLAPGMSAEPSVTLNSATPHQ